MKQQLLILSTLALTFGLNGAVFAQVAEQDAKRVVSETPTQPKIPRVVVKPIKGTIVNVAPSGASSTSGTPTPTSTEWSCALNVGQKVADPHVMLKGTDMKGFMWEYLALPGADMGVYKTHKAKAIRDGGVANIGSMFWRVTECINGKAGNLRRAKGHSGSKSFTDGELSLDASGQQDQCVVSQTTVPAGTSSTPCETGFALHHDTKECVKYGSGASTSKSHTPKGKWKPTHNTNNFERVRVPGQDYYRKKTNHSKRVYLSCSRGTSVNGAQYSADYEGNTDWCLVSSPGSAQVVKPMSCAAPWYVLTKG